MFTWGKKKRNELKMIQGFGPEKTKKKKKKKLVFSFAELRKDKENTDLVVRCWNGNLKFSVGTGRHICGQRLHALPPPPRTHPRGHLHPWHTEPVRSIDFSSGQLGTFSVQRSLLDCVWAAQRVCD